MELVIIVLLLICAICMVFSKPLKIEVTHRYPDAVSQVEASPNIAQEALDEQEIHNMDMLIKNINRTMGVNVYDDYNNPA